LNKFQNEQFVSSPGLTGNNAFFRLIQDVRLNKLTSSEFAIIAGNNNLAINWESYFISLNVYLQQSKVCVSCLVM